MPTELPKQYDPHEAQQRWLAFWEQRGYNASRPDTDRKPFTIVIPPPNVTGALHLGHALNNTLQDVLIRWRRMQGFNTLWMPGTDHAGIATQAVVERRIREEEKKTRHDLGREELVRRIWQWKDQYETRILKQLRELGCSCDWSRNRVSRSMPSAPGPCGTRSSPCFATASSFAANGSSTGTLICKRPWPTMKPTTRRSKAASGRFDIPSKDCDGVHSLLDNAARDDARRHRRGRASAR